MSKQEQTPRKDDRNSVWLQPAHQAAAPEPKDAEDGAPLEGIPAVEANSNTFEKGETTGTPPTDEAAAQKGKGEGAGEEMQAAPSTNTVQTSQNGAPGVASTTQSPGAPEAASDGSPQPQFAQSAPLMDVQGKSSDVAQDLGAEGASTNDNAIVWVGAWNLELLMDFIDSGASWEPYYFDDDIGASVVVLKVSFSDNDSGIGSFGFAQMNAALHAMDLWTEVANIRYSVAIPGQSANIYFSGEAYSSLDWPDIAAGASTGILGDRSDITMNTEHAAWSQMELGQQGWDTMVHEVGHSFGLDHPGEYNADDEELPVYGEDNDYFQDNKMYTAMSYFSEEVMGADYNGNFLQTLRTHDIYVMQQKYGVNWQNRDGDTVYGYNSTAGSLVFDFDLNPNPVLTIWDAGGNDTLDLSGDNSDVTLNLNPGEFSSTHGMTYNISLAYLAPGAPTGQDAYIENAIGGDGDDTLIGNIKDNVLRGGDGDDLLQGGDGDDKLYGGDDDDTLEGGDGDDELRGGGGDDNLNGGYGTDFYDGGAGSDTIDLRYSNVDWRVELAGVLDDPNFDLAWGTADNDWGTEELYSIENARLGDGDDWVEGSGARNLLYGGGGDDSLIGHGGDDELRGQEGDDTLSGGDGFDLLLGGDGNDRLRGGAGVDNLKGGDDDDLLIGDGGGDNLEGGDGDDDLRGGKGNDTLKGQGGNDLLKGGAGTDNLDGGSGFDTADYTYSKANWVFNLSNEQASEASEGNEALVNIEALLAGSGDDTLIGSAAFNILDGGGGQDSLLGLAGNDILRGGSGNDTLDGGDGDDTLIGGGNYDTASYATASAGVLVDLAVTGYQNTFGAGSDKLSEIEYLRGSSYDDWLFGDDNANRLYGAFGDDQLFGRGGNDWVFGEGGDDVLYGGDGDDWLRGGAGNDTASYLFASGGVFVSLSKYGAQNTISDGKDWLLEIENLSGSMFTDILVGSKSGNRIEGMDGNDLISGMEGDDVLFGNKGNDTLSGGAGNDVLEGGSGSDWAVYSKAVVVNLNVETQNTFGEGIDTLRSIENLKGSHSSDALGGNDGANELDGQNGNDWLFGRGGNDIIRGGSGNDIIAGNAGQDNLWGEAGNDTFVFEAKWGNDVVHDFTLGADTLDFGLHNGVESTLDLSLQQAGDGLLLKFGQTDSVKLMGLSMSDFSSIDFVF